MSYAVFLTDPNICTYLQAYWLMRVIEAASMLRKKSPPACLCKWQLIICLYTLKWQYFLSNYKSYTYITFSPSFVLFLFCLVYVSWVLLVAIIAINIIIVFGAYLLYERDCSSLTHSYFHGTTFVNLFTLDAFSSHLIIESRVPIFM